MKVKTIVCWTLVLLLASVNVWAQGVTSSIAGPCSAEGGPPATVPAGSACIVLTPGQWPGQIFPTLKPFVDGSASTSYGDPDGNIESLYGTYGNTETSGNALAHYNQGVAHASNITPLCTDGGPPTVNGLCANNNAPPAIVFLFLGFSNCELETCGGAADIWSDSDTTPLPGQPLFHLLPEPSQDAAV